MEIKNNKISIVIPCYNEETNVKIIYEAIKEVFNTVEYDFEIVFVNDGSRDNTVKVIKELRLEDRRIEYVSFSRNFGKESAILAGLQNSDGKYVIIMDADMQDPPKLIPNMIDVIETNEYDCVAAYRKNRKGESLIRSLFSRLFYKLINIDSGLNIVSGARDYRLMKREVVDAVLNMPEYNRFSKGIFNWIGFKTYWIPFENEERHSGTSKWSFRSLYKYALDGIFNFSQIPLSISSFIGVLFTVVAFIAMLIIIIKKILFGDPVAGWASLACIIIFIGGLQLLCMGIMGQYLSKIYLETKRRPHYIISDSSKKTVDNYG